MRCKGKPQCSTTCYGQMSISLAHPGQCSYILVKKACKALQEQGIPLTKQKCKACVVGALVADSAAVNLDK